MGGEQGDEGRALPAASRQLPACPKCHCDDPSMLEATPAGRRMAIFCNNCAHDWKVDLRRFRSLEDLIARTGINREELSVLAEIGALSAFGYTRREALWQVERAIRPAGELFEENGGQPDDSGQPALSEGRLQGRVEGLAASWQPARDAENRQAAGSGRDNRHAALGTRQAPDDNRQSAIGNRHSDPCPLPAMSEVDRVVADYEGTGLTIGPHPMSLRREEMSLRGALRAADLARQRDGRRVRVAGAVITRQRPGTAKGFVFLTLEDETGIANIIVRPDLFAARRMAIIQEPFLLVEGTLQNQEGVTSVRAERLEGIGGTRVDVEGRDFY